MLRGEFIVWVAEALVGLTLLSRLFLAIIVAASAVGFCAVGADKLALGATGLVLIILLPLLFGCRN